jgi:hypothetical protein
VPSDAYCIMEGERRNPWFLRCRLRLYRPPFRAEALI